MSGKVYGCRRSSSTCAARKYPASEIFRRQRLLPPTPQAWKQGCLINAPVQMTPRAYSEFRQGDYPRSKTVGTSNKLLRKSSTGDWAIRLMNGKMRIKTFRAANLIRAKLEKFATQPAAAETRTGQTGHSSTCLFLMYGFLVTRGVLSRPAATWKKLRTWFTPGN